MFRSILSTGFAARTLGSFRAHTLDLNKTMERLATGRRINRARDDPAGSITADRLSSDITAAQKRIEGFTRQLGSLAAKDGAHAAVGDLLLDLQGLVVSAANRGAMGDQEKEALQQQANSIVATINHLADTQTFDQAKLLDEAHAHQLGKTSVTTTNADGSTTTTVKTLADLANAGGLNLLSGDLEAAQDSIKTAINDIATTRGAIGSRSKDLESQIRTSQAELENLSAAKSQIVDADYAQEVSNLIRQQTLQQASVYMLQVLMQSGQQQVLGLLSNITPRR